MPEKQFNTKLKYYLIALIFMIPPTNSCEVTDGEIGHMETAKGYVSDMITGKRLSNAEVQVMGWYKNIFSTGYYSSPIDTGLTDQNGYFLINYRSTNKNGHSLVVRKDTYFTEEGGKGSLNESGDTHMRVFPHGYIKTHISNKIAIARWLEITFTPHYSFFQNLYKPDFKNTFMLSRAFADTTIITTTIGGVNNDLKIVMTTTDNTFDNIVVKDTTISSLVHDTLTLNIILK